MKRIEIKCKGNKEIPIHDLHEMQGNLKSLSKENFKRLKQEILRDGFSFVPHVWTDQEGKHHIIDGHQRLRVLRHLIEHNYECGPIPCAILEAISLQDAKQKLLAGASQYGTLGEDGLREFISDLEFEKKPDDLLSYYHFPELDLDEFIESHFQENKGLCDEESVPNISSEKIITKPGDIYQLGGHRLMCGDSSNSNDVNQLMNGQKLDLVFTDPPYGVAYEEKTKNIVNQRKNPLQIPGDELSLQHLKQMLEKSFKNIASNMNNKSSYYICSPQGGELGLMMMMMMMQDSGIPCRHMIIWVKNAPVFSMGRLDYDYQHEPILYGWSKTHEFYGKGQFLKSVWHINREPNVLHPTMKPIPLIENAILNSSLPGMIIGDFFAGSGSTIIACEKTSRRCFAMEIDPYYCDVAIKRLEEFTGRKRTFLSG